MTNPNAPKSPAEAVTLALLLVYTATSPERAASANEMAFEIAAESGMSRDEFVACNADAREKASRELASRKAQVPEGNLVMASPKTPAEAVTIALCLAISAPSSEHAAHVERMALEIASEKGLTEDEFEACKAAAQKWAFEEDQVPENQARKQGLR